MRRSKCSEIINEVNKFSKYYELIKCLKFNLIISKEL